ncbi:MAG: UPF0104 family protein [Candidatus Dadabacteria bacterium]|nr:MAG: UPF0104 family protein [Candidatus Dadabacteria bacterium]
MKKIVFRVALWAITILCLYFAFRKIEWETFWTHITGANPLWITCAVLLTCISYLLRSRRWQFLFPRPVINYFDSVRVLILGFFMNNILPARTGEFVRAHLGAKVTGETRTLVLATIASERLADGLTLSLMFVVFAFGLSNAEHRTDFMYVAVLFAVASVLVLITLFVKAQVFTLADRINQRIDSKLSNYTFNRLQVFINGLTPLTARKQLPYITLWSIVIWCVELLVYVCISQAFGAHLSGSYCVLFMVAVNFSSLIPAAPGGLGVIELITSSVLVSVGVGRELALSMVVVQHVIQYLVVGIPGALVMASWKKMRKEIEEVEHEQA